MNLLRLPAAILFPTAVLSLLLIIAVFADFLGTRDPTALSHLARAKPPSADYWFGTDTLGRDLYSRVIYGARISLIVGVSVAVITTLIGGLLGMIAGFVKPVDAVLMRIIDGIMAIPSVLLAIAMITLFEASIWNVIMALSVAEAPRMVRLVRSSVLTLRGEAYIEAARLSGANTAFIVRRHIFPNILAPVIVQATYVCAVAIISEAGLSFIGAGVPPITPSWGNIMAEGRALWQLKPHVILFPALFISVTVLAVNMLGDQLRDKLDPRMKRAHD